jgi:ribosome biogenesis GTPase A
MRITSLLLQNFRKQFSFPTNDVTHFFPGHMARGLNQMQQKMRFVDCVIEVHDARIPLSGRNPNFQDTLTVRPHLLVLNKMDLADRNLVRHVDAKLMTEQGINRILYTNCKQQHSVGIRKHLIPAVMELLTGSHRFNRENVDSFNLLIIGLPNVGKSSLINALRRTHIKKGKATSVEPRAGVTRSVLEKIKVCDNPTLYVYDTPGIMVPKLTDIEVGMKLALCATLTDHIVGEEIIADYMLFWLNSHGYFSYVDYFNLPEPTDDILHFLSNIAKHHKAVMKHKSRTGEYIYKTNFDMAAKISLRAFREGKLGRFNLDENLVKTNVTNRV